MGGDPSGGIYAIGTDVVARRSDTAVLPAFDERGHGTFTEHFGETGLDAFANAHVVTVMPDLSVVVAQMPPLITHEVDPDGLATLRTLERIGLYQRARASPEADGPRAALAQRSDES